MQRIILTAGGTGGHIFPALALAEELKVRYPHIRLLFVGGSKGPEGKLARQAGLEFTELPARGVLGRKLKTVVSAGWMAVNLIKAWHIVGRFKPDVVVGFGGYTTFATVLVGSMRGAITAIQEQNSIPGTSNRLLGRIVKRVFLALPSTHYSFQQQKIFLTGTPVRSAIIRVNSPISETTDQSQNQTITKTNPTGSIGSRLLVLGGSQGARAVNTAILTALPHLIKAKVSIWHQCGYNDAERVIRSYAKAGLTLRLGKQKSAIRVDTFIQNIAAAYAWADLAICRAGATTIAELAIAGKPAVLIPFPFATNNHQLHNARFLEQTGAALLLEERKLKYIDLSEIILTLLRDVQRRAAMSRASRKLARPAAASAIIVELQRLYDASSSSRRV